MNTHFLCADWKKVSMRSRKFVLTFAKQKVSALSEKHKYVLSHART